MRKLSLMLLGCCIAIASAFSQGTSGSIHSISITDIDGGSFNLGNYAGKKIMVFIAPVNNNDISKINEIDSFQTLYGDSIKLVGIMSYEHGYIDSNKAKIKNIYTSKGVDILLTEGMHTKNTSGVTVASFVYWLTSKSQNLRFNVEIKGIGQKFFINKQGLLYGVVPPEIPLTSTIVRSYALKN